MKNLIAYITSPYNISFIEEDIKKPRPGHVLIKNKMVALCGTDLSIYNGNLGYIKSGQINYPLVPGHEYFGEIADIGDGVVGYQIGDKVTSENHISCGICHDCRKGNYNQCNKLTRLGIGNDYPGAMADYVEVPIKELHKIPPSLSDAECVLIEPMAVGTYAVERAGLKGGDKVVIFGPGPIGLAICALSHFMGASQIVVVGTEADKERLSLARKMGATKIITSNQGDEELHNYRNWADIAFEATGHSSVVMRALGCVKKGGKLYMLSLYRNIIQELDLGVEVIVQQKQVIGGIGSPGIWEKTIAIIETGRIPVAELITHKFSFHQIKQAFDTTIKREENVIKTVISLEDR